MIYYRPEGDPDAGSCRHGLEGLRATGSARCAGRASATSRLDAASAPSATNCVPLRPPKRPSGTQFASRLRPASAARARPSIASTPSRSTRGGEPAASAAAAWAAPTSSPTRLRCGHPGGAALVVETRPPRSPAVVPARRRRAERLACSDRTAPRRSRPLKPDDTRRPASAGAALATRSGQARATPPPRSSATAPCHRPVLSPASSARRRACSPPRRARSPGRLRRVRKGRRERITQVPLAGCARVTPPSVARARSAGIKSTLGFRRGRCREKANVLRLVVAATRCVHRHPQAHVEYSSSPMWPATISDGRVQLLRSQRQPSPRRRSGAGRGDASRLVQVSALQPGRAAAR